MNPFLVSVVCFCLIGVAVTALYAAFYGKEQNFEDRLNDLSARLHAERGRLETFDVESESFTRLIFQWALRRMPDPRSDAPAIERLTQLLARAGFRRSGSAKIFYLARLASAVLCTLVVLLAAVVLGKSASQVFLYMVIAAAIGAFIPNYYIAHKARVRQDAIGRQLSAVLDLLVVCVEAGVGLFEAIKIVGEETLRQGEEIGDELTLVAGEVGAGMSLGHALRSLAKRTAVEDIKPLAATLIQSEQLGAQVGPALRASSDSLRTSRRLRAEEAAQKTTIKILFPLVLFVLPAMIIVIIGPAVLQAIRTMSM
jgi:tight adherence protein C